MAKKSACPKVIEMASSSADMKVENALNTSNQGLALGLGLGLFHVRVCVYVCESERARR